MLASTHTLDDASSSGVVTGLVVWTAVCDAGSAERAADLALFKRLNDGYDAGDGARAHGADHTLHDDVFVREL